MKERTTKRFSILRKALFIFVMLFALTSAAFAEDDPDVIWAEGVDELNEAYEYTIDTEQGGVKAAAEIASGWGPLSSGLSYMEFPEGVTTPDGESGVWCYCIDITTKTKDGHKYSVSTLDAAGYYEDADSDKIRAILINSYPHISIKELEERFGLEGLSEEEAFAATQWVIWYYSNEGGYMEDGNTGDYYLANIYDPSEYAYETVRIKYKDADGNDKTVYSENVVDLAKALDALEPAEPYVTEPAEIKVEKRVYNDKVIFDYGNTENLESLQNIKITVKAVNGNDVPFALSGNKIVVQLADLAMGENGAGLTVNISGDQKLNEDVYFFSPEGGRSASQSRVAVFGGMTPVAFTADFALPRAGFEEADADAQLKVTKKVLLNGEAHRSEGIYYVALFEDEACTLQAFNGDVREIRMGGEAIGSVVFDELMPGKTYYIAETDADGDPLKDGDMGIAVIAYDKQEVVVGTEEIAEVTITNCYIEEKSEEELKEEPEEGGVIGDGGPEEPGDKGEAIDEAVDTGDNTNIMMLMTMMMLMTLAMIGMVAVLLGRRRAV